MSHHLHRATWIACALFFLNLASALPAAAQFIIHGPRVEQGELEIEDHSWIQDGLPGGEGNTVGHSIEVEYGLTNFWKAEVGLSLRKPVGEDYEATAIELENTFQLFEIPSLGATVGFLGTIEAGFQDHADAVEFGPLIQFGNRRSNSLILNGIFEKTFGENREDGTEFEYRAQFRHALNDKLGVGVEAFGEIEDIDDAPEFDDTELRIGPMVYLNFGDDDGKGRKDKNKDPEAGYLGDRSPEYKVGAGVLVGVTDATPDTTFKMDLAVEF